MLQQLSGEPVCRLDETKDANPEGVEFPLDAQPLPGLGVQFVTATSSAWRVAGGYSNSSHPGMVSMSKDM